MKRQRRELFVTLLVHRAIPVLLVSLLAITPASAAVLTDNFDDVQDYSFGPGGAGPNEPWTGMENLPGLIGDGLAVYDSNATNPGVLTIQDNGTGEFDEDPGVGTGPPGLGWEGNRSTSPFLFADVPAGKDFTATVKISAQTSGFWSAAGIIARAGNSPTPPGVQADHADENFTTAFSFRTDFANNAEGNTLQKRIENGAQVNDNNFTINAAGTEPFPILVRMERVGGGITYREWVSTDNGVTWQFQSRVRPTAGNALRDPAVGMQVGLSFMTFGNDLDPSAAVQPNGYAQFDDFVLEDYDPRPAPGAPVLPAMVEITLKRSHLLDQSISDLSGLNTETMQWALIADGTNPAAPPTASTVRALPALLPGAQGGQPAVLDAVGDPNGAFAPFGSTRFRWNTHVRRNTNDGTNPMMLTAQSWTLGDYGWTVRATNDWGEISNDMRLIVHLVIPEPSTMALFGLAIVGLIGRRCRRC
jgi:hypothetical protein